MSFERKEQVDKFIAALKIEVSRVIKRLKNAEAQSEGEAKARFEKFRRMLETAVEWQEFEGRTPCQGCEYPLREEEKICPICNTEQK